MDAYRLINLISALVNFYEWLVFMWCLMWWFGVGEGCLMYDVAVVIDRIVSPYMNLFRRFIPPLGGMDFSPIVGLFVLSFGERLIFRLLLGMA